MSPTEDQEVRVRTAMAAVLCSIAFMIVISIGHDVPDGRQWEFKTDMNGDGRNTVRDVPAIVGWFFFYPGDLVIYCLRTYLIGVSDFFEITSSWYGGVFSFLIALVGWPIAIFTSYGMVALVGFIYGRLALRTGRRGLI